MTWWLLLREDPRAGGNGIAPGVFMASGGAPDFPTGGCTPLWSLLDRSRVESACVIGTRGVSGWLRRRYVITKQRRKE